MRISDGVQTCALPICPSLLVPIAGNWSLSLSATYARSHNNGASVSSTLDGVEILKENVCYCNSLKTVEGYLEGGLLSLPGGELRTVIGGGLRHNRSEVRSEIGRASCRDRGCQDV